MKANIPFLKPNHHVAIIATAKCFTKSELKNGIKILNSWGLIVEEGKHLYKKNNQFAGTDEERLSDLQHALNDPKIKAIFCVRGGYGTNRIIDKIDFTKFIKNPKWIIGFSDITVLHAALQNKNFQSIHGIMPLAFGKPEYKTSVQKLKEYLFGSTLNYTIKSHKRNKEGTTKGKVVGGNLSILCSIMGTPTALKTNNKILFLEDIGENLYKVDRMIIQLKRAGIFKNLKGLIVGHFTEMEDNKTKFGKSAYEIIHEAIGEYNFPVCYNFPAGHEPENMPLLLGKTARLSVTKKSASLIY